MTTVLVWIEPINLINGVSCAGCAIYLKLFMFEYIKDRILRAVCACLLMARPVTILGRSYVEPAEKDN